MSTRCDERKVLITAVVRGERPLEPLVHSLKAYGWECDHALVTLMRADVIRILSRFLNDDCQAVDVAAWAEAVEIREDIALEPGFENVLQSTIVSLTLADTDTDGWGTSKDRAHRLLDQLTSPG